ncbi:hypothetical protein NAS2_0218 [Conexivisphaera calida]|uniref:Uncharacterized protein n=1 Tax=Conexivisphaera calida TaxID=1874277 RepID=A0A4P2VJX5_9ARCH|nr:hypothetical protein NAS2_0218 [Conexivisphaera calida]
MGREKERSTFGNEMSANPPMVSGCIIALNERSSPYKI